MIDPAHLRIETMASGHLTLVLREDASWADFEIFAPQFLAAHGGVPIEKADSPVERVWTVTLDGAALWLAFDDYAARFELNARDAEGDAVLKALAARLGLRDRET
jgi:hypothetical protein